MHSDNDQEFRDWANKLETGVTDDPTLVLANRLRGESLPPVEPPAGFKADLRRQLLTKHGKSAERRWQPVWRLAASAAMVAVLAVALYTMWSGLSSFSAEPQPGSVADAATGDAWPDFTAVSATLADEIELVGVASTAGAEQSIRPGEKLGVRLALRAKTAPQANYNTVVQLIDETGALIASDEMPQNELPPSLQWVAGELVEPEYELALPDGLQAGTYSVVVRMVDSTTGELLPLSDGEGLTVASVTVVDSENPAFVAGADVVDAPNSNAQPQSVVWLDMVRRLPQTSAENSLAYEMAVHYTLGRDVESASLLVQLAHPDWATLPYAPVVTVTELIPLAEDGERVAFGFTVDGDDLTSKLDSAEAVLLLSVVENGETLLSSAAANLPTSLFVLGDSLTEEAVSAETVDTLAAGNVDILPFDLTQAAETGYVVVPILYFLDGTEPAELVVVARSGDETVELTRRAVEPGQGFSRFGVTLPDAMRADLSEVSILAGFDFGEGVGLSDSGRLNPDDAVPVDTTPARDEDGNSAEETPTETPEPSGSEPEPTSTPQPDGADPTSTPASGGDSDSTIPTRTPTP